MRTLLLAASILVPIAAQARAQTIDTLPTFRTTTAGQEAAVLRTASATAVNPTWRHMLEVFKDSDGWTASSKPVAAIGQSGSMQVQMDPRTFYPDGNVATAELTFQTPGYKANAPDAGFVLSPTGGTGGAPLTLSGITTGAVTVDITPSAGPNNGHDFHFDGAALLGSNPVYWRDGPLAAEAHVSAPVEGQLRVAMDITENKDGTFGADVTVASDQSLATPTVASGDESYTAVIHVGNNSYSFTVPAATPQAATTNWHIYVPSNGTGGYANEPSFWGGEIIPNFAVWETTGIIPQYPLAPGVYDSFVQSLLPANNGSNPYYNPCSPLSTCGYRNHMEGTGGRPDIGVVQQGQVNWIESGNLAAYVFTMQQEDAAGSLPWHINSSGDAPVSVLAYPNWWEDDRCNYTGQCPKVSIGTAYNTANYGRYADNGYIGVEIDTAHAPLTGYIGYLSTGSRYYYEEAVAVAGQSITDTYSVSRQWYAPGGYTNSDLVLGQQQQERAGAWAYRSIQAALNIMPSGDPSRAYFDQVLTDNNAFLAGDAVTVPATVRNAAKTKGTSYGWIDGYYASNTGQFAAWQNDYLALSLEWATQSQINGHASEALNALTPATNWLIGRFNQSPGLFDPFDGINYELIAMQSDGATPLTSWGAIETATQNADLAEAQKNPVDSDWKCFDYDTAAQAVLYQLTPSFAGAALTSALNFVNANINSCHNNAWVIGSEYNRGPAGP